MTFGDRATPQRVMVDANVLCSALVLVLDERAVHHLAEARRLAHSTRANLAQAAAVDERAIAALHHEAATMLAAVMYHNGRAEHAAAITPPDPERCVILAAELTGLGDRHEQQTSAGMAFADVYGMAATVLTQWASGHHVSHDGEASHTPGGDL